jgi:F-box protein 21
MDNTLSGMDRVDTSLIETEASLISLPDEVLLLILTHIPPSTVLSLSVVCRRFYGITLSPKLWKHYCQTSFTTWDKRHDYYAKLDDKSFDQWKALFATRHAASTLVKRAFDKLLDNETDRFDRIHEILSVGYDAKDFLLHAHQNSKGEARHLTQRLLFSLMIRNLH